MTEEHHEEPENLLVLAALTNSNHASTDQIPKGFSAFVALTTAAGNP
ncbi:RNA polymerase sigma factor domain protein [Synechococcus sp. WH 8103]|nr:RNA polymerase sigma factor domain protein [Synechococcus sp. WH 8103]